MILIHLIGRNQRHKVRELERRTSPHRERSSMLHAPTRMFQSNSSNSSLVFTLQQDHRSYTLASSLGLSLHWSLCYMMLIINHANDASHCTCLTILISSQTIHFQWTHYMSFPTRTRRMSYFHISNFMHTRPLWSNICAFRVYFSSIIKITKNPIYKCHEIFYIGF